MMSLTALTLASRAALVDSVTSCRSMPTFVCEGEMSPCETLRTAPFDLGEPVRLRVVAALVRVVAVFVEVERFFAIVYSMTAESEPG